MRWLVAFHLVGVVLWMGSLMALSRVMGFHTREPPSVRPRFSFVEERLDLFAAVPGGILTLLTGLAMLWMEPVGWFAVAHWLHVKLVMVVGIAGFHAALMRKHRRIARERADQELGRAFVGAAHGTLGLLLIAVIILAVVRPY